MNFYSLLEIEKEYGISKNSLKWRCLQGDFKDAKQVIGSNGRPAWVISENDVLIVKDESEYISNSYTLDEATEKLNCAKEKIESMMNQGLLTNHRIIRKKRYFNRSEIEQYATPIIADFTKYYDSKEVSDALDVSVSLVSHLSKEKHLKHVMNYRGKHYFLKEEVDAISDVLKNHYTTNEVSKLFGTTLQNITSQCTKGNFKGAIKNPIAPIKWLIPKQTIDLLLLNSKDEPIIQNEYDVFPTYTKTLDVSIAPKTYSLFHLFFTEKLKKSRSSNKIERAKELTRVYKKLYEHLSKELFHYRNDELDELLKADSFESISYKEIALFLKFLKKQKTIEPAYDKDYSFKRTKKKTSVNDNIYSKEIWGKYYLHLTKIDRHIELAMKNQSYACTWLYCMLHLVLSWRSSDLLKMPNIRLEEVGIYDFGWFYEHEFTLSIGENIINQVRNQCEFIRTGKTGTNAHFIMTLDLIIPVSVAFVIAEIHRRKNNHEHLLQLFQTTKPKKDRHIILVMQDKKELLDFSSLKANRTLLTYGHENAVQQEGMAHLAYDLGTYMRSHKKGIDGVSSVTEQYIYSTNEDGSVNDVSYNLFRRGFFGWLYREIIEIAESNTDKTLTMKEETALIESAKEQYDLMEIENIAGFLQEQLRKKQSVVQELLSYEKEQLQEIIARLIKKEMPSKMKNAQCLKSGECPFLTASTCFGCQYLIPEYYLLYSIRDEMNALIDKLEQTPSENEMERIKNTHFIYRMLYLLQDVKKEYTKYDPEFVNNFFNMKELQDKLNALQKTKFKILNKGE